MGEPKTQIVNFLIESDFVSLSSFLKLDKNLLLDKPTGAKHRLHPKAVIFLKWLATPKPVADWPLFARKRGVNLDALEDIAVFLNSIGGLQVDRNWTGKLWVVFYKTRYAVYGIRLPVLARRWPANFSGLAAAVTKSSVVLLAAVVIVDALSYLAGFSTRQIILYSTVFYFIIWFSTFTHELTHILIARRYRQSCVVIQRGLRLGILHQSLTNKRHEILSSLAGPGVGILCSLSPGVILAITLGDGLLAGIGSLIALFHVLSLLPAYGDGKILLDTGKEARH